MGTAGVFEDLADALPAPLALTPQDLAGVGEELAAYHAHFAPLFQRREQREWARVYLQGLLTAEVPRKNVEALALRLRGAGPGADRRVRALQHRPEGTRRGGRVGRRRPARRAAAAGG